METRIEDYWVRFAYEHETNIFNKDFIDHVNEGYTDFQRSYTVVFLGLNPGYLLGEIQQILEDSKARVDIYFCHQFEGEPVTDPHSKFLNAIAILEKEDRVSLHCSDRYVTCTHLFEDCNYFSDNTYFVAAPEEDGILSVLHLCKKEYPDLIADACILGNEKKALGELSVYGLYLYALMCSKARVRNWEMEEIRDFLDVMEASNHSEGLRKIHNSLLESGGYDTIKNAVAIVRGGQLLTSEAFIVEAIDEEVDGRTLQVEMEQRGRILIAKRDVDHSQHRYWLSVARRYHGQIDLREFLPDTFSEEDATVHSSSDMSCTEVMWQEHVLPCLKKRPRWAPSSALGTSQGRHHSKGRKPKQTLDMERFEKM